MNTREIAGTIKYANSGNELAYSDLVSYIAALRLNRVNSECTAKDLRVASSKAYCARMLENLRDGFPGFDKIVAEADTVASPKSVAEVESQLAMTFYQ